MPLSIATSTYLPHEGPITLRKSSFESYLIISQDATVYGDGFAHSQLNTPDGQLGAATAVAALGSTPATVSVAGGTQRVVTPVGSGAINAFGNRLLRNTPQSALAVEGAASGATIRVIGGAFAHAILNSDETLGAITAVAAPGNTPATVAVAANARRVITPLGPAPISVFIDRP